jgi:FkbM family methyltransferase
VLYGAGNLGRFVLCRLTALGYTPVIFADDTPGKQGTCISGLRVYRPEEVISLFGPNVIFVVTVFQPLSSFVRIRDDISRRTGAEVISFLNLAFAYSEIFLPFYQFETPEAIISRKATITSAFDLFTEPRSRREFIAHLFFRLNLDFDCLPVPDGDPYIARDLFSVLSEKITFVDAGAFEGDTLGQFIAFTKGKFRRAFAFEPDTRNFEKLECFVRTVEHRPGQVQAFRTAVGARSGTGSFRSTASTGSKLDPTGSEKVSVVALDDVVPPDAPLYLKYDVEGAEKEALEGSLNLIRTLSPIIAVSVYHLPNDLWEIPLWLRAVNSKYSLFLRTHGHDGMDLVCYALPRQSS